MRAVSLILMIGGTTSAVQSMILSVCKSGDKIILPRNVHKSVINALVICGAVPVYVEPEVNDRIGIALAMETAPLERTIKENPDAVAVLVNNPLTSLLRPFPKIYMPCQIRNITKAGVTTCFFIKSHIPTNIV